MNRKHIGARNEMYACTWLLDRGYEVFRNVSAHGLIDIIAMKDGETHYFDVKGNSEKQSPKSADLLSKAQTEAGVKRLNVFKDGSCEIIANPRTGGSMLASICCGGCGQQFTPRRPNQRFCASKCRSAHANRIYSVMALESPRLVCLSGKSPARP